MKKKIAQERTFEVIGDNNPMLDWLSTQIVKRLEILEMQEEGQLLEKK